MGKEKHPRGLLMVSKNYIPMGERSIRARERDRILNNDPEIQEDLRRISAKLARAFNKDIITKLRGKDLFIMFMKTPEEKLNDIPSDVWERIEHLLRTTPEKIQEQWMDEENIVHKNSPEA